MKYNLILILLTVLAFAACKDKKERIPYFQKNRIMSRDADFETHSRRGTRTMFLGSINLYHISSCYKDSSYRKTSYYSDSHTGELYIDTVYQGSHFFVRVPMNKFIDQPHLNKIIIKSMAYELNPNIIPDDGDVYSAGNKGKEILDCRVLKDLKSGEVEKIVVYIDSVEYLVDLNKNKITKRKE